MIINKQKPEQFNPSPRWNKTEQNLPLVTTNLRENMRENKEI